MKWNNTYEIAELLEENYNDEDLELLSSTDLYQHIIDLEDFSDDLDNYTEDQLMRIKEAWQDLRNED